jgi:hypothetical protein
MKLAGDLSVRDGRPFRRRRLAAIVTALAAVAIAVTPTGSAGPPSSGIKQYAVCLTQTASACDTSALPGGSMVSLTLTIKNANSSTQSLGSANVDGPVGSNGQPIFPINLDPAKGPVPTFASPGAGTFDTNTSGQLQLRNLNLPPGSQVSVSFSVMTPCAAATGTWKVPAKQRNDFLGSGNDFTLTQSLLTPSGGLTSSVGSGGCKLVWLYPPNHANIDTTITNTAYTPTVGGDVHYVSVKAVAGDGVTPIDLNSGTATIAKTGGTFDCVHTPCEFSGLTSTPFVHGVATFPNLKSANTGIGFTLQASATGLQPTPFSDPPFNISLAGTPCDAATSCSLSNQQLGGRSDSRLDVSASSGLTFLGVNPYSYDPTSQNCGANFVHVAGVTGFEEFHGGVPNGLTVTYYVNQKNIEATYGKNVGAQYIPICAGTFRVVNGLIVPCTNPGDTTDTAGWPAAQLDSNGRFTGTIGHAICRSDGRYWGIVPSFQDKTNPADGPQTVLWGSKIIDGVTYRFFTMAIPSQWDYRGGC